MDLSHIIESSFSSMRQAGEGVPQINIIILIIITIIILIISIIVVIITIIIIIILLLIIIILLISFFFLSSSFWYYYYWGLVKAHLNHIIESGFVSMWQDCEVDRVPEICGDLLSARAMLLEAFSCLIDSRLVTVTTHYTDDQCPQQSTQMICLK